VACGAHPATNSAVPHLLALRPDGSVIGWGRDTSREVSKHPTFPAVKLTEIAAGIGFSVGLDTANELHYWGAPWAWGVAAKGPALPPPGPFESIGAGTMHFAAVRRVQPA
jgi:hypothetical protein